MKKDELTGRLFIQGVVELNVEYIVPRRSDIGMVLDV